MTGLIERARELLATDEYQKPVMSCFAGQPDYSWTLPDVIEMAFEVRILEHVLGSVRRCACCNLYTPNSRVKLCTWCYWNCWIGQEMDKLSSEPDVRLNQHRLRDGGRGLPQKCGTCGCWSRSSL